MSNGARSLFGGADNLVDTVPAAIAVELTDRTTVVSAVCLYRIFERGDSILIGVQLPNPTEDISQRESTALLLIHASMMRHYFRLQRVERNLSTRARQR